MEVMSQFQPQVPHPLRDQLPALLPAGRVRAPAVWVLFAILIRENGLKGPAMQVEFDDIAGRERLLRQGGEEEFIDDAFPRHANWALFRVGGMGGYDHAAAESLRSHWHDRAVVEAAHHRTFATLLKLIGWQMQTSLHERMIKHTILLAASHKGEVSQIGKDGPRAILSIESQQGAR